MSIRGPEMEIPSLTLYQMLKQTVDEVPDKRALIFAGHEQTYAELHHQVQTVMGRLQELGIKPGDRVGIMLPNCPQYVASYYAITGIGAIVVQISPISAGPELEYLLTDSGCRALVAYSEVVALVQSVRPASLETVIAVRFGATAVSLSAGDRWFDEWLTAVPSAPEPIIPDLNAEKAIAVLQYTGGTTGRSKGAMLTHRNLVANVYQSNYFVPGGSQPDDVVVCALPLFHVYAMTICMNLPIAFAGTILLVPRFDAKELLTLVDKYKATSFPGVPTMYVALTQVLTPGSTVLSSLRICNSGGAPLPVQVLHRFEELTGAVMSEGYGLSESSPVTHSSLRNRRKVGSIGIPAPETEVKIVAIDDPSREMPDGESGELAIRGPQVMKGYWNRPEETARTLVDGWLLTGDIALIDDEGFTFIVDRKKDLIIASGFNVYPRDVEEALYKHPAVLEAAVVGVPDEYRGETVKAFVVLREGENVTEADLIAFCRQQLAPYKVPRMIEFKQDLPKSAVGKVLRRSLRA